MISKAERAQWYAKSNYSVVVVSYLSRAQVEQLLVALPSRLPVVLVDNARNADGLAEVAQGRPAVRYLDSGGGKGFAKAANMGARTADRDYVVFVNPDSRPGVETFERLIDELELDPTLASAAAVMVGHDGRPEIGVGGWEPSVGRALVHALGAHKLLPRSGLWARPRLGERIDVDWTTGACLAVRRSVFLGLGGFDERYYVYNEDVAFGRRARHSGLRQALLTDVPVLHGSGKSGGGSAYMLQLRGASFVEYLRDHASRTSRELIRLVLSAGLGGRIVAFSLLSRTAQAEGHRAYLRGLWRGRPADPVSFPEAGARAAAVAGAPRDGTPASR